MSVAPNRLWHPFADMSEVAEGEIVVSGGEGPWVTDEAGRRYLDASAGLWYCNVGHGRAELAGAARAQMARLASYQTFDVFANRPALDLAERLADLAPSSGESAAFFTSGGSDGIETIAKMVRRFWAVTGKPERQAIIARAGSYHGMSGYGTSLAGIAANAQGWGELAPGVIHVERDDADALERLLEREADRIAAFIGEPVQGAAGVFPPQPDYWQRVRALCRRYDVLLVADEVVTGFGRLGQWFGCERYEFVPDAIVVAKGLSSGYLPIGAVIVGERIRAALWSPDAGAFRHGYTYSGHPTACAVALANLDVLERERLVDRVRELEPALADAVGQLRGHSLVEEVRCAGLLAGVELSAAARLDDPQLVARAVVGARERGVLVRNLVGETLQISPPFVVGEDDVALIARVLKETLDDLEARTP